MFFFSFNFHDNNFLNVIEVLTHLIPLDQNELLTINDEDVFVCVFTLLYINDMSQQQKNAE